MRKLMVLAVAIVALMLAGIANADVYGVRILSETHYCPNV
jgi:hypothetical protein